MTELLLRVNGIHAAFGFAFGLANRRGQPVTRFGIHALVERYASLSPVPP